MDVLIWGDQHLENRVLFRRLAQLEALEIDQYVWGILTNLSNCDVDEVTIDGAAAWKPVVRQSPTGGAMKEENEGKTRRLESSGFWK